MHDISGPSYPLSREEIRHALHVGLGRARVHVEKFGVCQLRDDILEVATVCKTYDPQVEGLPTTWLAELCTEADIVDEIITRSPDGTGWDRRLRCALLKEFAARGAAHAKAALYSSCQPMEDGSGLYGDNEIIELDGEAGLLFVARTLGDLIRSQSNLQVTDEPLRLFDFLYGEGKAQAFLRGQTANEPSVGRFLDAVEIANRPENQYQRRARATVGEVMAQISAAKEVHYGLGYWGRHATADELELVLNLLQETAPPIVLENTLRCLSGSRTFPPHPSLFAFIRNESRGVRQFAAQTLGHHVLPRIRDEGLAALSFDVEVALTLLRKNARADDASAIFDVLTAIPDVHRQHGVVSDVVHLLKDNGAIRDQQLALYVYERSPCTNCRGDAVKLLLKWNNCPQWLRDEGIHDSSEEIREACQTALDDAT